MCVYFVHSHLECQPFPVPTVSHKQKGRSNIKSGKHHLQQHKSHFILNMGQINHIATQLSALNF